VAGGAGEDAGEGGEWATRVVTRARETDATALKAAQLPRLARRDARVGTRATLSSSRWARPSIRIVQMFPEIARQLTRELELQLTPEDPLRAIVRVVHDGTGRLEPTDEGVRSRK
jgi:hypothetical protein